jgi:hypothetical protein
MQTPEAEINNTFSSVLLLSVLQPNIVYIYPHNITSRESWMAIALFEDYWKIIEGNLHSPISYVKYIFPLMLNTVWNKVCQSKLVDATFRKI